MPVLKNEITYCNIATRDILNNGGDHSLDNMLANDMYDYLSNQNNAVKINYNDAVFYAKQGITIIMAVKMPGHGHVAVVAPYTAKWNHNWQMNIPQVFNAGDKNGIGSLSVFFRSTNKPDAFILQSDLDSFNSSRPFKSRHKSNNQTTVTWKKWITKYKWGMGDSPQEKWDEINAD